MNYTITLNKKSLRRRSSKLKTLFEKGVIV